MDKDENEHQLLLRNGQFSGAKDELHIVQADAVNYKGSSIKGTLSTLKMWKKRKCIQPKVSLRNSEITPPIVLRPMHISGLHLVAVEKDAESDEVEDVKLLLYISGKQFAREVVVWFHRNK